MKRFIVTVEMPLYYVKAESKKKAEEIALLTMTDGIRAGREIGCLVRGIDPDELDRLYPGETPVVCKAGDVTGHIDHNELGKVKSPIGIAVGMDA